jgi:hypothetical protein
VAAASAIKLANRARDHTGKISTLGTIESVESPRGGETSSEENLVGYQVPDPGDQLLVEQHRLDGRPPMRRPVKRQSQHLGGLKQIDSET